MNVFLDRINNLYSYLRSNGCRSESDVVLGLYLDYICTKPMVKSAVRKNKIMHLLGPAGGESVGILSPYRSLNSRKENKLRPTD